MNAVQSLLLLGAMAGILSALGWIVAGVTGVIWALGAGVVLVALNPAMSPALILNMYRARRLTERTAPELHRLVAALALRAELAHVPQLFYVPSTMINAFAVGTRRASAIGITDGLLRALHPREIAGVLAHEVTHVRNNDTWVMGLADLVSRLTSLFSSVGQLLLLLNLPLLLFSDYGISWTAILLLIFAPTITALLQLALSRTREYDADLGAAELTGDPKGLASALAKLERYQGRLFEQILFPGRNVPEPSVLRTHPPTEERVRRLLALAPRRPALAVGDLGGPLPHPFVQLGARRPRWRPYGIWY